MRRILIDAHVHLHPGADPVATLTAAHHRMAAMAGSEALTLFMLAEQQGHDMFDALRPFAEATDEAESLWLRHDGADLLVLAGRQVISAERLEVLALATAAHFEDGPTARDLVSAMLAQDALVILPWGIGKWLGRRGNLVDRLMTDDGEGRLLLGDIGSRPVFWPVSRFGTRLVLRGSDPLPLVDDDRRIGTYGTILEGKVSRDRPARDIRALIRQAEEGGAAAFGRLASPLAFLSGQLRLRLAS